MTRWKPPTAPKYRNRRCLACRTCRMLVEKTRDNKVRMANWHTPGHPEHSCDGAVIEFDAKGEAKTWLALCDAEDRGWIEGLERQPKFEIRVEGGVKVGVYRADFAFKQRHHETADRYHEPRGRLVELGDKGAVYQRIVDTKGHPTPLYKMKKRCVEGMYGVTIEEWRPGSTAL